VSFGRVLAGWIFASLLATGGAAAIETSARLEELIQAQWRQQDGLAQDTVFAILQTRDGFLWCGTRTGLSRFDGVRFESFGREEMQLEQTARVQALAEDSSGALWIGTGSGELVRYRDGAFRRFGAADGLKGEGRAVGRIAGLVAGQAGELWVATYSEGVFRLQGESFERIAATAAVTSITRLAVDAAGDLWMATIGRGIFRYRQGEPLLHLARREGLPNDYVSSVVPARSGGVWIATHSGICLWRDGRLEVWGADRGLVYDHVTALWEDHAGNVWFASFGGGVQRLRLDGSVDRLPAGELGRTVIVWDVYEDRSGMIWTGTVDQGLLLLAEGAFSAWRAYDQAGLASRLVTALAEDRDGTFWIGSRDAGLSWRREGGGEPAFGRIGRQEGLEAEAVWSLDCEDGIVWVGTSGGLFRVAGGGRAAGETADGAAGGAAAVPLAEFAEPPAVQALAHDGDTRYVGTDRGLLLWPKAPNRPRRLLTKNAGLPADSILDLELDREGRLWIATAGGLAVFEGALLRRVRDYDRLGAGQPLALHADPGGELWVVAGAGGLVRIADGEAAHLTHAGGLYDDNIYALHEDHDGFLWLGTSSGILRIARADLSAKLDDRRRALPQTLFDRFDGVDPGAIAAFGKRAVTGRDGRLRMATFGGVAVYAAGKPGLPGAEPRPMIETVLVDGAPIGSGGGGRPARIAGSHRHLAFELAAPLPHAGRKIRLRYRLSAIDQDWVEAGPERRAAYSGLAPGSYRFEVQASNPDGEYLAESASYLFLVDAGFFKGWQLPVLVLLGLAAVAWVFHRFRARQELARQRELDARIAEATADIRILHGLLPLCGSCHKVRGDQGYWQQVETYLAASSGLEFTHGFCPDCARAMIAQIDQEEAPAAGR
jgi:ligand-binding sensor domain-containing protein